MSKSGRQGSGRAARRRRNVSNCQLLKTHDVSRASNMPPTDKKRKAAAGDGGGPAAAKAPKAAGGGNKRGKGKEPEPAAEENEDEDGEEYGEDEGEEGEEEEEEEGRGFHSSTSQLNPSRFCQSYHPALPQEVLTLSRKVDECQPLKNGDEDEEDDSEEEEDGEEGGGDGGGDPDAELEGLVGEILNGEIDDEAAAAGASHSAVDVLRDGYDPVTLEDERDTDEVEVGPDSHCSHDGSTSSNEGSQNALGGPVGNGIGRYCYCSPRHRMPFNSRSEC